MQRDLDIDAWRVFLAVARAGTISSACDECMADASRVSRTIFSLEKSLGGVPLFDRRTRPFKLTENGRIALEYARTIVQSHDDLVNSVEKDFEAMEGPVRVGLPPILQIMMRDFLIGFIRRYPGISLSVLEYRGAPPIRFDGPQGKFDIISAYGPDAAHENLVQIHYGDAGVIPCASPEYLARRGTPRHPSDLAQHSGIVFGSRMRNGIHVYSNGKESVPVRFRRETFFDSGYTAIAATVGGAGIHPGIPVVHCARDIAAGRLVPLLPGWYAPILHLYIYTRPELVKFRRVRVFIEEYRRWLLDSYEETRRLLKGRVDAELIPVWGGAGLAWGEKG